MSIDKCLSTLGHVFQDHYVHPSAPSSSKTFIFHNQNACVLICFSPSSHALQEKKQIFFVFAICFFPGNICYFFPLVPIVFPMFFPIFFPTNHGKNMGKTMGTFHSVFFSMLDFFPTNFPMFSQQTRHFPMEKMADLSHRRRGALTGQRCSSLPQSLAAELSPPFDRLRWLTKVMVGLYIIYSI